MPKISATIVTLNESRNLPRAIESLRCVDEIVVIDSGSTDDTCAIAKSLGARVIFNAWPGYAEQKNLAAAAASNEWILSLDADEALSEVLEAEIMQWKSSRPEAAGYSMPRMAQYLGRWIRHSGWYPDRKVRLYHRDRADWAGSYVHESVRVRGTVGEFQGDLLHFTCDSISEHLRTLDKYTTLAAKEMKEKGKSAPTWKLVVSPAWAFIRSYFLNRGFIDGPQGLTIAWMAALYVYLKYAKARGLQ